MKTKKDRAASRERRRSDRAVMLRLVQEAKPIYKWLALACLISLGIIACAVAAPRLLGDCVQLLYDYWAGSFTGASLTAALTGGCLALAGVYLLQSLMSWLKMLLLNNVVSRYFTCALRIKLSAKISRLPVSFVDRTPVGQILDRMTEDVSTMGNSIHSIIDTLMVGFLQIIAIAVMMLLEDWRLALVVILFMPVSVLLSIKISNLSGKHFERMFAVGGQRFAHVEESFTNYQTTKAYNYEQATIDTHHDICEERKKSEAKANFFGSLVRPCIAFSNALAYIIICVLGGVLIVENGVSIGVVVTVVLFARQFSSPLEQIADGMSNLQRTKAASKRVFDMLDAEEEPQQSGHIPADVKGDVKFEDVSFSYSKDTPLIRDLNIDVKRGQKIAIVGPTGAGKTTMVNLLMRFFEVNSGRITIDGVATTDLRREDVHELFGMVLQDTWLFEGTIRENLVYNMEGITDEQLETVCKACGLDKFVHSLPQGFDTVLSESTTISAGQKQLLTIARAMLQNAPMLILDEATSSVDTRTELLIQRAMDELTKGRTSFVIAHRLSTIKNADLILVMRDGDVIESGTHEQLMEQNGFYAELYNSQFAQAS